MSGNKTMTVTAGISSVAELGNLIDAPLQAYKERQRRKRLAALQREAKIQQKISQIQASIGLRVSESKAVVQLPQMRVSTKNALAKDFQNQLEDLKSRLPKIKAEYLTLLDKQIMDAQTVKQVIDKAEQALANHDLATAETYLQALDDERIERMQQVQAQCTAQIEYLQERLDGLRAQLPQALTEDLQSRINHAHRNWQQLADTDIQQIHLSLSDLETQAEQIQEAALNLMNSWIEVGYHARIVDVDNGDVVIEVATHESVNTQIRLSFNGEQINLFGPPEESEPCAERTMEALQIFQRQGYELSWTTWDGEEVPEEWRHLYAPLPQKQSSQPRSSQRRLEQQGY